MRPSKPLFFNIAALVMLLAILFWGSNSLDRWVLDAVLGLTACLAVLGYINLLKRFGPGSAKNKPAQKR
jgi:hypothetical protein